eukprot:scaffold251769_cov39-Prasinocladus_malaysianus.AAC.1
MSLDASTWATLSQHFQLVRPPVQAVSTSFSGRPAPASYLHSQQHRSCVPGPYRTLRFCRRLDRCTRIRGSLAAAAAPERINQTERPGPSGRAWPDNRGGPPGRGQSSSEAAAQEAPAGGVRPVAEKLKAARNAAGVGAAVRSSLGGISSLSDAEFSLACRRLATVASGRDRTELVRVQASYIEVLAAELAAAAATRASTGGFQDFSHLSAVISALGRLRVDGRLDAGAGGPSLGKCLGDAVCRRQSQLSTAGDKVPQPVMVNIFVSLVR